MNPRSSVLIIFLVVFIDLVGFGIVIPILPYYAQTYGASGWLLGLLMASYSAMQFFFAPLWGRISDRIGRRPVLLISILGTVLSMTILGFAGSLEWLFIGRIFAGISGANLSTAYAYISDVTTEENRAKGMGLIGAAFGLGFIFGPAIGGLLSHYGYSVPMFAGAGLAAINLIFAYFKLEEPPLSAEARASHRHKRFDWNTTQMVLSQDRCRFAIGIFFLFTFALTQMEVVFAIFLKARFNYGAQRAGMLLALMGLIMAGIQGGLIGRLAKKYGEYRLILFGTLVCSLALAWFAVSTTLLFVILSLTVMAVGHGVSHPSLSSLASKGSAPEHRGATMGVFQSAGSLARVVGPPCAGWLYDHSSGNAPFIFASVVLLLAFLISVVRSIKARESEMITV